MRICSSVPRARVRDCFMFVLYWALDECVCRRACCVRVFESVSSFERVCLCLFIFSFAANLLGVFVDTNVCTLVRGNVQQKRCQHEQVSFDTYQVSFDTY
jgi:hypothetical protein